MMHVFTDDEQKNLNTPDYRSFEVGSFGGPAKPGIPNAGWAMAYGEQYAPEIDVRSIKAAGFSLNCINDVVVQITEDMSDVVNNFEGFSQRRSELKRLFPSGFFLIENEMEGHEKYK